MKNIILAMMLLFPSNVEHQSYLHSINSFQETVIIHDDNLSRTIAGGQFMNGFCVAVGIAAIVSPLIPPLATPVYVASAVCAIYAAYNFFN